MSSSVTGRSVAGIVEAAFTSLPLLRGACGALTAICCTTESQRDIRASSSASDSQLLQADCKIFCLLWSPYVIGQTIIFLP